MKPRLVGLAIVSIGLLLIAPLYGQQTTSAPEPKSWTTAEDHQHLLAQLGIRTLRPGPSGNEKDPNHANYDEALAAEVADEARSRCLCGAGRVSLPGPASGVFPAP